MVDLLRQISVTWPTDAYLDVINALWSRLSNDADTDHGHAIGGRDLIIALVKSIDQRWPDADLSRLTSRLRVEASTKSA